MLTENQEFLKNLEKQSFVAREINLQKGLLLTSQDFCKRREISLDELDRLHLKYKIFAIEGPSGNLLYPAFFAESDVSLLLNFEKVSQALNDLPDGAKWRFFMTPKLSLGGKIPVDALRNGEIEEVLNSAAGFREN